MYFALSGIREFSSVPKSLCRHRKLSVTFFLPEGENSQRKVRRFSQRLCRAQPGREATTSRERRQPHATNARRRPHRCDRRAVCRRDESRCPILARMAPRTSSALREKVVPCPSPPRVCTRCWFCVDYDEWVDWGGRRSTVKSRPDGRARERVRTAKRMAIRRRARFGESARAMRRREALEARESTLTTTRTRTTRPAAVAALGATVRNRRWARRGERRRLITRDATSFGENSAESREMVSTNARAVYALPPHQPCALPVPQGHGSVGRRPSSRSSPGPCCLTGLKLVQCTKKSWSARSRRRWSASPARWRRCRCPPPSARSTPRTRRGWRTSCTGNGSR